MLNVTRALAGAVLATVVLAGTATASPTDTPYRRLSGSLDSGASWIADVPADWNGVLLLFGHGYRPPGGDNPAQNAPDPDTAAALLDRGYALAGSSYATAGWTLDTAADDQLATLAAVTAELGEPRRTIAVGQSMGGLVTAQIAERDDSGVDAALALCGLVAGGVGLLDFQLDGAHALAQLLLPGEEVPLAGFADAAQVHQVTARLLEAIESARHTPQGRARVALAAALFHLPTWHGDGAPPEDPAGRAEAQVLGMIETLPFILPARLDIESRAGGNASTNVGVDYRALLQPSATKDLVGTLYREAGLDLHTDLDRLTATAATSADPAAREWLTRTSTITGELDVPVLTVHTVADALVPVQFEDDYADRVRTAGEKADLRTAFVDRTGHCTFTPAEVVAAVEAVVARVETGRWGGSATTVRCAGRAPRAASARPSSSTTGRASSSARRAADESANGTFAQTC
ncbi:alpha/beta hydrolase [Pseudonocardia nigra]|uniref:alpha/beta hydrolase n=1 Tax=Pseudonocardia nigra TaxID=1921578 RepID=UPI001C5E5D4D|nr:alpha/beta hydrolase [Pseudonocardia nigra]